MDLIVQQAMQKWPNVPHCHGWLALDSRGHWRMRDEKCQQLGQAGDKITNVALLEFINRNYTCDARCGWYFQNGPQRVYVTLEAAPFIARTDPRHGLLDHTGQPLTDLDQVWFSDSGNLWFGSAGKIAMLDDRDLAHALAALRCNGLPVADEQLMQWLADEPQAGALMFEINGKLVPVAPLMQAHAAAMFGFIASPQPESGTPGVNPAGYPQA